MSTHSTWRQGLVPVIGAVGGILIGSAWIFPGTVISSLLEWLALLSLVFCAFQSHQSVVPTYLFGLFGHSISIYWLPEVITSFSEKGPFVSYFVYGVYVLFSALQFPFFQVLMRNLPDAFRRCACSAPIAWVVAEVTWSGFRWFPWQIGHMQLAFLPFVQIAELGGTSAIAFCMFWICETIYRFVSKERRGITLFLAPAALLASCIFGMFRIEKFSSIGEFPMKVAMIQIDSRESSFLTPKFKQSTESLLQPVDLVIWPQGALNEDLHESIGDKKYNSTVSSLRFPAPLLVYTSTHRPPEKKFKSIILLNPDGSIPIPYHKRMLVPYGEFIPFVETFPWMRKISPSVVAGLTRGDHATVYNIPLGSGKPVAKVAPIICYEDLFPQPSRDAVENGAEVLVDIASGVWAFSDWPLKQHHVIASFRSIENRRALIRSSSVGITAVVDATGRTSAALPGYSNQTLIVDVQRNSEITMYSRFGNLFWWMLSGVAVLSILVARVRGRLKS